MAIIIPAHNEERGLPRLLAALAEEPLDAEIVVVANGCTDATAEVARGFPGVTVVETPVPSKIRALAVGDRQVTGYPRLYVDGDVVLRARDVRALCRALEVDGVHAVGPSRHLPMEGVSAAVRGYYRVWQRLDGVRSELYGRGVVAVDEIGHARLAHWPEVMSDDLMIAMSFAPAERAVAPDARVLISPPRRYADLLRRRVRAMTGNRRLAARPGSPAVRGSGASLSSLAAMAARDPRLLPGVVVFLCTAVLATARGRLAVARGETTWLRDESSRT